jgi:DNA-binding NtrC family response regulator
MVTDGAAGRVLVVVGRGRPLRVALAGRLAGAGVAVTATVSVEHAIRLLERRPFDVLVADLRLRGVRSDLIFHVRRRLPRTPLVVLDPPLGQPCEAVAHHWGAIACFRSPVPLTELTALLLELIPPAARAVEVPAAPWSPPAPACPEVTAVAG